MTAIGWISLGTLCTKVLAVSNTFPEMLDYTTMAISVCASAAAVIAISNRVSWKAEEYEQDRRKEVARLKLMADQTPFAESRRRLIALAERLETDDAFAHRNSQPIGWLK
jgi:hypothetical protein